MSKIYFATTNPGKIREAQNLLNVAVEGVGMDIDEVQSLDPVEVAVKKAESYYKELQKPILIEDVSLTFKALNKLPGTFIDYFFKAVGNSGLVNLLENYTDRSAIAQTTLVFINEKGEKHVFEGTVEGSISREEKGENGFGWDPIFIPEGENKTFAEMIMEEKAKYSMRARAFEKLKNWIKINNVHD